MNKTKHIPSILIAAPKSGSGKTTVTAAVMGALVKKGLRVCAYKSGPDYIDPMLHKFVTGHTSKNLDSYMCSPETVKYLYADGFDGDIAVIEGAMGYYDGVGDTSDASAYEISKITEAPVLLVVEPVGTARSVGALVSGFCGFESGSNIRGVILNNIKPAMYEFYKNIIEKTGVRVYGYLPHIEGAVIKSRHLGLFTAAEIDGLSQKTELLSKCAIRTIDIDGLLELAENAPSVRYRVPEIKGSEKTVIAVARDNAFCFYYDDNIRLLEKSGAQIKYVSPLTDDGFDGADGLYIGGGYPELYARELSDNICFRRAVKAAAENGMPIYGECGGFMYLSERLVCDEGAFDMCGVLKGESVMKNKLGRFGYIELTANTDSIMCKKGTRIRAHEFHYSDSSAEQGAFTARKPNGVEWTSFCVYKNVCAGYPHIHFYSNTDFVLGFIESCVKYKKGEFNE